MTYRSTHCPDCDDKLTDDTEMPEVFRICWGCKTVYYNESQMETAEGRIEMRRISLASMLDQRKHQ